MYRPLPIYKIVQGQGRKRKEGFLLLMTTLFVLRSCSSRRYLGRPFPVRYKRRKDFWRVVSAFNARQFRKAFRMTCFQFRTLTTCLAPVLDRYKVMTERSSGSIQAEVKVALMLRFLAGASYHDLCLLFDIPSSSVYYLSHRTIETLLVSFALPGLPTDIEELKRISLKFQISRCGGSPLMGCVGALDGIAIKTRKPSKRYHPAFYYCRKHFYAIPVQAIVDEDYRFRSFSAVCVGFTHDSLSHAISALGKYLSEGKLSAPFWIAADEAYICTEYLLTPFSSSQLDRSVLSRFKDAYNFFHSSLRIHVEQAFGQLVDRFGILWRPMRFSLATNVKVILATMILHNFCIDHSDGVEVNTMSSPERELNRRAFRQWYRIKRAQCNEHSWDCSASLIAQADRGMAKSRMRADMVERLRALRRSRPYGQHRFNAEPEDVDSEDREG